MYLPPLWNLKAVMFVKGERKSERASELEIDNRGREKQTGGGKGAEPGMAFLD